MVVGTRPPAIDAHFATAQDFVNMGARHALEYAQEEIVEALAGFLATHLPLAHPRIDHLIFLDCMIWIAIVFFYDIYFDLGTWRWLLAAIRDLSN
jgi:hypothetical protein